MSNKNNLDEYLLEVKEHQIRVFHYYQRLTNLLSNAVANHDNSRLNEPELSLFAEDDSDLEVAWEHHYKANKHHLSPYNGGIKGMDLVTLTEMFCDWVVSSKESQKTLINTIQNHQVLYKLSDDLVAVLLNTVNLVLPSPVDMIPVDSSHVETVGYDPILREIYVTFKGGTTYRYFDVSESEFNEMLESSSVGSFIANKLKPCKEYQKVR